MRIIRGEENNPKLSHRDNEGETWTHTRSEAEGKLRLCRFLPEWLHSL